VYKLLNFIAALIVVLILSVDSVSAEEAKYTVVFTDDIFELRSYDSHILAEVLVQSNFEDAGGEAFRPLFDYISGNNIKRQKVSMTAPVSQQGGSQSISMTSPVSQTGTDDSWLVSFMMPSEFSLDTIPEPIDPRVVLRLVPARYIASVKYSGFWSHDKYQDHYDKLLAWIAAKNLNATGDPVWARYNAPYTPWFLRRNEILLPIKSLNSYL
jgi:effector-binding domain-containing protein